MLLYPWWQEIKNKTKTFSRTLFICEGAAAGSIVRKQSTLCLFTDSHVRWFVLKSSIKHFYHYICIHLQQLIGMLLFMYLHGKSLTNQVVRIRVPHLLRQGGRDGEDPNNRSHVHLLKLLRASKRIVFLMGFKIQNTLFSYVYF